MTAPAARPENRSQVEEMISLVEGRGHLASILGNDPATVERFKTILLSALTGNEKLMRSDPATLVQAIREAAMWDLEPDGIDAVIVPYWNSKRSVYEADFQVMARGYVTVLYRSPRIRFVDADVVYANDTFVYEKGAQPVLRHVPLIFGDRGERVGAYAVAQLDSGFFRPIVLNEEAITSRRKRARDPEKGTWAEWPDEMARKTALRALISLMPIERGVRAALAAESQKYALTPGDIPLAEISSGPIPPPAPANVPAIEAARQAFLPAGEPATATESAPEPSADPEPIEGEAIEVDRDAPEDLTPKEFWALVSEKGTTAKQLATGLDSMNVPVPNGPTNAVNGLDDLLRMELAGKLGLLA